MVTHPTLCDRAVFATGPLSLCHWAAPRNGEGQKTPGQQCQIPPARAYALGHLLFLWIWTHEQILVSGL